MDMYTWLIYLAFVLVATSTPGPAVLFAMTNATLHGLHKAIFAALGNITGLLLMGTVAVTGLGVLLNASEVAFDLIKYAGAAYLVFLGMKLILQKGLDLNSLQGQFRPSEKSALKIYVQALGVALSNPKAIVFLTALFPQFISVEQPLVPQFLILMITLMFFSFSFLFFYSFLACKATLWLLKPARMKIFSRVSGGIFIGFGVFLATSQS